MYITNIVLTTILSLAATSLSAPQKRDFTVPVSYNYIAADDTPVDLEKRNTGGVRLSDGADFSGHVWYGILPVNDCIALNSYAHNLGSFRPDEGMECLLYQGECDANKPYGDLHYDSPYIGNLAEHYADFIDDVESFMCSPIL